MISVTVAGSCSRRSPAITPPTSRSTHQPGYLGAQGPPLGPWSEVDQQSNEAKGVAASEVANIFQQPPPPGSSHPQQRTQPPLWRSSSPKKNYIGFKIQVIPVFDAEGIDRLRSNTTFQVAKQIQQISDLPVSLPPRGVIHTWSRPACKSLPSITNDRLAYSADKHNDYSKNNDNSKASSNTSICFRITTACRKARMV